MVLVLHRQCQELLLSRVEEVAAVRSAQVMLAAQAAMVVVELAQVQSKA